MTLVTAVTENIKISVVSRYQPDFSAPILNKYFFSYTIRIENKGPERVKLLSRFWHIKDALGSHRFVEGEGVVGEQPLIAPGGVHEYTSACDFETPIGSMTGYYVFERINTGTEFRAEIPEFLLEIPSILS